MKTKLSVNLNKAALLRNQRDLSYEDVLAQYVATAEAAAGNGLGVNAGHDLNLDNLPAFKRNVSMLAEVCIGHAITADALQLGFATAVKAYLSAIV
jgi:pyridoxine 5-phosphate synthase